MHLLANQSNIGENHNTFLDTVYDTFDDTFLIFYDTFYDTFLDTFYDTFHDTFLDTKHLGLDWLKENSRQVSQMNGELPCRV